MYMTNTMQPLVSVVIPTHNRCDLLWRAISSALQQTYTNLEVIVVSDGSEDSTDALMEQISEQRVRYIAYHPSKGANVARNTGIAEAKGEYVAFLDDDDEWYPQKIEKQIQLISKNESIGLVCTGIRAIYVKENITKDYVPPAKEDSSKEILIRNCIGSTTTVLVEKALLDLCGGFDPQLGALQDYDLWIRLCQKTKVGVVREPCVDYYVYTQNNQISSHTENYEKAILYIERKYQSKLEAMAKSEKRIRKRTFCLLLSKKGLRNGQPKLARKYAVQAFAAKPSIECAICFIGSFVPYRLLVRMKQ